jgi:hypothetical protein
MLRHRFTLAGVWLAILLAGGSLAWGQLPVEPGHNSGLGITGAFEGWFKNPDGTFSLLAGYFNRNAKEEIDIPVGPANRIEPGPPDQGQPTHFAPRRQWGVFRIIVPKDFGDKKLKWTIVANGKTNSIPLSLNPLWEISPFKEESMGNTPPTITFPSGPAVQGPLSAGPEISATVGSPLELSVGVADDAKVLAGGNPPKTPPLVLTWSVFRGPAPVTFSAVKPVLPKFVAPEKTGITATAVTEATFSEAGHYILMVVANDWSGDGGRGFQCCWTVAHVKVNVAGGQTSKERD